MSPRRFRTLRLVAAAQVFAFCVLALSGTASAQAGQASPTITANQAEIQRLLTDLDGVLSRLRLQLVAPGDTAQIRTDVAAIRQTLSEVSSEPTLWWERLVPWTAVTIVGIVMGLLWASANKRDQAFEAQKLTNERELKPKVLELEGQKQRLEQIFALLMKSDAAGDATKLLERIEALEQTVCRIGTPAHDAWPKPAGK